MFSWLSFPVIYHTFEVHNAYMSSSTLIQSWFSFVQLRLCIQHNQFSAKHSKQTTHSIRMTSHECHGHSIMENQLFVQQLVQLTTNKTSTFCILWERNLQVTHGFAHKDPTMQKVFPCHGPITTDNEKKTLVVLYVYKILMFHHFHCCLHCNIVLTHWPLRDFNLILGR